MEEKKRLPAVVMKSCIFHHPKKYSVSLSVAAVVAWKRICDDNEQKKMATRGDGEGGLSGLDERKPYRGLRHVG